MHKEENTRNEEEAVPNTSWENMAQLSVGKTPAQVAAFGFTREWTEGVSST